MVGEERLELSRVAPHAPKACVYTNFTTRPSRLYSLKDSVLSINDLTNTNAVC